MSIDNEVSDTNEEEEADRVGKELLVDVDVDEVDDWADEDSSPLAVVELAVVEWLK